MHLAVLKEFDGYRIKGCGSLQKAECIIEYWLKDLKESYPDGKFPWKIYKAVEVKKGG